MEFTIVPPKGILQIDDAILIKSYRNFTGAASKYNREGDRDFSILIPDEETANELIANGWNVKIKQPREDGDDPFMYLKVKVKFNDFGPNVYLQSGNRTNVLDESTIGCLDRLVIQKADIDIRPYDWEINGKTGRTAYLQGMHVVQGVSADRFADRYDRDTLDF